MISVETNARAIIVDLEGLNTKAMKAAVRSMNRAIVSARATMAREIAQDVRLGPSVVKAAMPVSKATFANAQARFGAGLKRIPLLYFKAKQTQRGVSYNLSGSRSSIASAFLAKMKSGHEGVFRRNPQKFMRVQKPTWTKKRPAIMELWGPSLGHVFKKYLPAAEAQATAAFDASFAHEWERITGSAANAPDLLADGGGDE